MIVSILRVPQHEQRNHCYSHKIRRELPSSLERRRELFNDDLRCRYVQECAHRQSEEYPGDVGVGRFLDSYAQDDPDGGSDGEYNVETVGHLVGYADVLRDVDAECDGGSDLVQHYGEYQLENSANAMNQADCDALEHAMNCQRGTDYNWAWAFERFIVVCCVARCYLFFFLSRWRGALVSLRQLLLFGLSWPRTCRIFTSAMSMQPVNFNHHSLNP